MSSVCIKKFSVSSVKTIAVVYIVFYESITAPLPQLSMLRIHVKVSQLLGLYSAAELHTPVGEYCLKTAFIL